jgi:hypothetical protein
MRWLPRSRRIVLAMLAVYFLALVAVGGHQHWGRLGVPPDRVTFGDLRSITSGWECTRRGIDVMPANPCDPYKSPANYPRIWMSPAFLGLGQGSTNTLGVLVALIFFCAALAVLPATSGTGASIAYGLALCSPAVMLGVERGNVDILMVALVALAVLLFRRSERSRLLAHALILFAAILKLVPIFGAGFLLRQTRRRALAGIGVVLVAFGLYALSIRGDLRTIQRVTPQSDHFSYGMLLFTQWLASVAAKVGSPNVALRTWNDVVAAVVVVAALVAHRRGLLRLPGGRGAADARDLDLFVAGAGVYLCTYLLFRNFDYRLAFLLLTLPQLLRWTRERSRLAAVSLAALFGTLWLDADLTKHVPVLGAAVRGWKHATTLGVFDGTLPAAVLAQFVLFAGLIGCLAARRRDLLPGPQEP